MDYTNTENEFPYINHLQSKLDDQGSSVIIPFRESESKKYIEFIENLRGKKMISEETFCKMYEKTKAITLSDELYEEFVNVVTKISKRQSYQ